MTDSRKRVQVFATFTAEPLEPFLKELGMKILHDEVSVYFETVGQVMRHLICPHENMLTRTNSLLFNLVFLRWSDIPCATELTSALHHYEEQAIKTDVQVPLIVVVCPIESSSNTLESYDKWLGTLSASSDMLSNRVTVITKIEGETTSQHAIVYDSTTEKMGMIPYANITYSILAQTAWRVYAFLQRPPIKVCFVDCDNTLWFGIIGEDGEDNIQANIHLMKRLKSAKDSGMLLVTCSKNNHEDVERAFKIHADRWPLKYDDFIMHKVNWNPKSLNIHESLRELNLSSFSQAFFLDDNFAELDEVRLNCPGIYQCHVPDHRESDQRVLTQFIYSMCYLDIFRRTKEDGEKTRLLQEEFRRQKLRTTLTFSEYVATLRVQISITKCANAAEEDRVVQLSLKTNQFNFTSMRLRTFPKEPTHARIIRVSDKYGDYGIVGVVLYEVIKDLGILTVQNLMLSCRALGRGVEEEMLRDIGRLSLENDCPKVCINFVQSTRNAPVSLFLQKYDLFSVDGKVNVSAERLIHIELRDVPSARNDLEPKGRHTPHLSQTNPSTEVDSSHYFLDFLPSENADLLRSHLETAAMPNEGECFSKEKSRTIIYDVFTTFFGSKHYSEDMNTCGVNSVKIVQALGEIKRRLTLPHFPDHSLFLGTELSSDAWNNILWDYVNGKLTLQGHAAQCFHVHHFLPEDWPQIKAFIHEFWDSNHPMVEFSLFEWQYRLNASDLNNFLTLKDTRSGSLDGMFGMTGIMFRTPFGISHGGEFAMWMVKPSTSQTGGGLMLFEHARSLCEVIVGVNNNDDSGTLYLAAGAQHQREMPRFVVALGQEYAQLTAGTSTESEIEYMVTQAVQGLSPPPSPLVTSKSQNALKLKCAIMLEEIWCASMSASGMYAIERSRHYWLWRYLNCPSYFEYVIFAAKHSGIIVGRLEDINNGCEVLGRAFRIVDVVPADPKVWRQEQSNTKPFIELIRAALTWGRQGGAIVADFWCSTTVLSQILSEAGFTLSSHDHHRLPTILTDLTIFRPAMNAWFLTNLSSFPSDEFNWNNVYLTKSTGDGDRPSRITRAAFSST